MPVTAATIRYSFTPSPLGSILLSASETGLRGLHFTGHAHSPEPAVPWERDDDAFEGLSAQLAEYFDGRRTDFDVPLDMVGTAFERQVWAALLGVGYGETASYGEIARRIGRPGAARAIGAANGRNPVSIIVPCHRVIGADASLTGYGWGVDRKAWLLDLERRTSGADVGARPQTLPGMDLSR
ncbi:MAG: methylated-DNA--[protein]-cysteine S-methyltransferase [Acidimicrobiales bacterium]